MRLRVWITGNQQLIARLRRFPERMRVEMTRSVTALAINFRDLVQQRYLSGPTGRHTLSVRTGRLRRSVDYRIVTRANQGVIAQVYYGADVPYARIHEYGGRIQIPEIRPVRAQALHFFWRGQERFYARVRAHVVRMPQRAPLRTAFHQFQPVIRAELQDAARRAVRGNRR